jgi:hypothetical protein
VIYGTDRCNPVHFSGCKGLTDGFEVGLAAVEQGRSEHAGGSRIRRNCGYDWGTGYADSFVAFFLISRTALFRFLREACGDSQIAHPTQAGVAKPRVRSGASDSRVAENSHLAYGISAF